MAMRENVGKQSSLRIPSLDTGLIKHYDSRRASNQTRIGTWLQQGSAMEKPKKDPGWENQKGRGSGDPEAERKEAQGR